MNESRKLNKNQSARNIHVMEHRDIVRRGSKYNNGVVAGGLESCRPHFNGTTLFKNNNTTLSRNKSSYINFN